MTGNFSKENDFGCTKCTGVTDMTTVDSAGTLIDQLEKAGIQYEKTVLSIGVMFAEAAYLIHYVGRKSGKDMTILVIPQVGADSWAEDYFYFPGMTKHNASELNWFEVQEHVRAIQRETILKNIPVARSCPNCGAIDGVGMRVYKDIRGKSRCGNCHHKLD